ncbi:hypothetical protein G6F31_016021 [Rhizopus arrhizus]|nr:hypothetical protein G6F31_016021 [Rhizopus arrhizus]
MRRDQPDRLRMLAMRQRDAGIGRTGQRGGDAGHHFIAHAMRAQIFQFFAAPSKDERVAAFQAHHAPARLCVFHQQRVDACLGGVMVFAGQLADRHAVGIAARQRHDVVADQAVIQNDVGFVQGAQRLQRQQAGGPRACPHQHHAAVGGRQRRSQCIGQGGFSPGGLLLAQKSGHGAVQQPVIEAAARAQVGVAGPDALAIGSGQAGQLAQRMVEQRFDATVPGRRPRW